MAIESIQNLNHNIDKINAEIHASVDSFNAAVGRVTKLMSSDMLLAFHQKVSLDVLRKVVNRTPVDTGRAKGGWQSSIKGFKTNNKERFDETGGQAINEGSQAIASLKPFGVYYLSNNVPYILFLEDGHSKQSRDMVKLAIEEVKREVLS